MTTTGRADGMSCSPTEGRASSRGRATRITANTGPARASGRSSGRRRAVTLYLRAEGAVSPTRMERWITLSPGRQPSASGTGSRTLGGMGSITFGPSTRAWRFAAGCQLLIRQVKRWSPRPGLAGWRTRRSSSPGRTHAGKDGKTVDLSRIPTHTVEPGYEMAYLTELHAGWFAMLDPATRSGFGLNFDPELFNSVWVFQTHGGWRGLHVANIEPATAIHTSCRTPRRRGDADGWRAGKCLKRKVPPWCLRIVIASPTSLARALCSNDRPVPLSVGQFCSGRAPYRPFRGRTAGTEPAATGATKAANRKRH